MSESEASISDTSQQLLLLDDVPVPSASKDFNSLLEECLKDPNLSLSFEQKTPTKKFAYLKKGEGLARFYSNSIREKSLTRRDCRRQSNGANAKKEKAVVKADVKNSHRKSVAGKVEEKKASKEIIVSKKKANNLDVSYLDSETRMNQDLDEVRVFEIMEEKVENSSFCSTSSTVMAFLHHSSPLKSRLFMQSISQEQQVETKSQLEVPNVSVVEENLRKLEMNRWENLKDVVGVLPYGMEAAQNYDSNEKQSSGLHVRFSNLNEYRTYGSSDVSLLSVDSESTVPSQIVSDDDQDSPKNVPLPPESEEDYSDEELTPENSPGKEEKNEPRDEITFNSELLKSRLIELKNEIEIFRKENAGLMEKQRKLDEERAKFKEHVKENESKMNLEKQRIQNYLEEEKKLVAKEKSGLASRLRNAQELVQKSARERAELRCAKKELEALKEAMSAKDGKWLAQQGRYKSQLRVLQTENSKLKQEMEKLRESQSWKMKKSTTKVLLNSNARSMHRISKMLDGNGDGKQVQGKQIVQQLSPSPARETIFEETKENERQQENLEIIEGDENKSEQRVQDEKFNRHKIKKVVRCEDHIDYWYNNGNVKKVYPGKQLTKTVYYNGDVQEKYKDGKIRYFYSTTRTWHTTLVDGVDIFEFPDGQIEKRWPDGRSETTFTNGSVKTIERDGTIKWVLSDGTLAETSSTGEQILTLPNGQKEIHTEKHKRREYPDGTVKFVYSDGTQETRYANGRLRLKDSQGNLVMDSLN